DGFGRRESFSCAGPRRGSGKWVFPLSCSVSYSSSHCGWLRTGAGNHGPSLAFFGDWLPSPTQPCWPSCLPRLFWFVPATASAVLFFAFITPWMVRNRMVFGKWVFIRGNAPFEFTLGNYHLSNGLGWFGKHPTQNKWEYAKYARMGEVAYIAEKQREGMAFVKEYPGEFMRLCLKRFDAF